MRVKILDNNQTFTAISNHDIVLFLWQNSFQKEPTMLAFMVNYARRAVMIDDIDIRATNVRDFVEDLVKYKHIAICEEIGLN